VAEGGGDEDEEEEEEEQEGEEQKGEKREEDKDIPPKFEEVPDVDGRFWQSGEDLAEDQQFLDGSVSIGSWQNLFIEGQVYTNFALPGGTGQVN